MATSMSTASLTSQTSLLQSTEDRMLHQLKSQPTSKDAAKIEKGAKDFEAMLLTTWMQQAEKSLATVPGAEGDEDAAGREQMMSLGVQSVAQSLAAHGGIGISRMIAKAMHSAADKADAQASNPAANPENMEIGKKP